MGIHGSSSIFERNSGQNREQTLELYVITRSTIMDYATIYTLASMVMLLSEKCKLSVPLMGKQATRCLNRQAAIISCAFLQKVASFFIIIEIVIDSCLLRHGWLLLNFVNEVFHGEAAKLRTPAVDHARIEHITWQWLTSLQDFHDLMRSA